MRIDPIWRPVLGVFSGMRDASFAEVAEEYVRFRFGMLFDHEFPREDVKSAGMRSMQWWDGYGWRLIPGGRISLLGSHSGVVQVNLRKRSRAFGVVPCNAVAMSLVDPGGFLAELGVPEEP